MNPLIVIEAVQAAPTVARFMPRVVAAVQKTGSFVGKTADDLWNWAKKDKVNASLVVATIASIVPNISSIFPESWFSAQDKETQAGVASAIGMGAILSNSTRAEAIAKMDETFPQGIEGAQGAANVTKTFNTAKEIQSYMSIATERGYHGATSIVDYHTRLRGFLSMDSAEVKAAAEAM